MSLRHGPGGSKATRLPDPHAAVALTRDAGTEVDSPDPAGSRGWQRQRDLSPCRPVQEDASCPPIVDGERHQHRPIAAGFSWIECGGQGNADGRYIGSDEERRVSSRPTRHEAVSVALRIPEAGCLVDQP